MIFRVNDEELALIKKLSKSLQRDQSDAVRTIVITVAREIERQSSKALLNLQSLEESRVG